MDALLSDINQAGLGRGLQFELFRPGQVVVKDYYAELPIAISVSGRYHDIGSFAADIANLSRIVTLHNMNLDGRARTGVLSMEATARTYRYLDPAEIEEVSASGRQGEAGPRHEHGHLCACRPRRCRRRRRSRGCAATRTSCSSGWSSRSARSSRTSSRCRRRRSSIRSRMRRSARSSRSAHKS